MRLQRRMTSYAFLHFQGRLHKLFFSVFHETAFRTFYAGRSAISRTASGFPSSPADSHACPRSMLQNKNKISQNSITPTIKIGAAKSSLQNRQSIVHKTVPKPPASVEWIFQHRAASELFCARCPTALLPQVFSEQLLRLL